MYRFVGANAIQRVVWGEAQFEESVLACFTSRTDVLDTPSPSARQREPRPEGHAEGFKAPSYSTYWAAPKAGPLACTTQTEPCLTKAVLMHFGEWPRHRKLNID